MIRIVVSSSGRSRLSAAENFVRSFSPTEQVLLVGSTREAADDLVRGVSAKVEATFGLHRFSFFQLVAFLASEEVAARGLAPASSLGAAAVAARTAFEARGQKLIPRLDPVIRYPGFARALSSTLEEVRLAGLGPGDLSAKGQTELGTLLDLFNRHLDRASLADRATQLELAVDALRKGTASIPPGVPLLLLDVPLESTAERGFVRALLEVAGTTLATVPEGDEKTLSGLRELGGEVEEEGDSDGATSLGRLRAFLFGQETPPEGEADDHVRFFSAPGEGRECVEIARQVLAEARAGTPFDRMAVFLRAPVVYSPLIETAFRRARIPTYFARGTRRPDPSGRAFLALLACRADRLSARRFAEYLSFAQVPALENGAPPRDREVWSLGEDEASGPTRSSLQLKLPFLIEAPPDSPAPADADDEPAIEGALRAPWKWEELLVEAAVIGGKDRWARRLEGLEHELALKVKKLAIDEPESPRMLSLRRELTNLGHLKRFALPVIETLDALPDETSWGEWLRELSALAPSVLRRPDRVLSVLADLRPMAEVGPVSLGEVAEVLGDRLSTLEKEHSSRRYGCVFVAPPEQARGRSFQVVFVPGLAERIFPQRPREDPLLLDTHRKRLSDELETQEDRGQRERTLLRLAVGVAEERVVLSYPRVDVVQARPRVPSFYGLDVVRATRGTIPDYEDFERDAEKLGQARLAWPAPPDPDHAIDPLEHDLAILRPLIYSKTPAADQGRARYLMELNPHLARSLRSRYARWHMRPWRPEDGLVRKTDPLEDVLEGQRMKTRPYSATALQKYAACPYQFLLSAIHRLQPREDAVALVQMDPLTRGSMFHEIQADFLRALKNEGRLPVTEDGLEAADATLAETLTKIADEYGEKLAPAIPRIWDDAIETIHADLKVWLRRMARDDDGWIPRYFEYTFGLPINDSRDPESLKKPISLPGGWLLRGAVDLIETNADESAIRVTDHKTGSDRTSKGMVVGGGETLQPVLYGMAIREAMEGEVQEGRLYFCTAKGGFKERRVPLDERAVYYGTEVLKAADDGIRNGVLPPAPRKDACRFCDFRTVCGPDEENRSGRKDPRPLAELNELRTLP